VTSIAPVIWETSVHAITNCCLLKFSINTVRTKVKDKDKLQISLRNNRINRYILRASKVTKVKGENLRSIHREPTILLNRKRVNKRTKRTNSTVYLCLLLFSRDLTAEKTATYKYCVALNSYLGFPALLERIFCALRIKFDEGAGQLFAQTF